MEKYKLLLFLGILQLSFCAFAQKPDVKTNNALNRSFSLSIGSYYTRIMGEYSSLYTLDSSKLLGHPKLMDSFGFSYGYGFSVKTHLLFRGFRNVGLTLGWDFQTFPSNQDTTLKNNLYSIGIKYYPAKKWYLGVECFAPLQPKAARLIKKKEDSDKVGDIGLKLSLNKEFLIFSYPFEVNIGGQVIGGRQAYKKINQEVEFLYYNVNGGINIRI